MKHASNGEVLMFKKPLDARLHQLLTYIPELNLASIHELEFISNFQAIQVSKLMSMVFGIYPATAIAAVTV